MKKIVCFCENSFDAEIPEVVDLGTNPEIRDSILEGNFFLIKCPNCNSELRPEFPLKVIDEQAGVNLFLIPELDRNAYYLNKLEYPIGKPERIVIGFRELVEKLALYKAGLNDNIIEIIKFYILGRAVEGETEGEVRIYFSEKIDEKLIFFIDGLKKDEIARYEMKMEFYNKVKLDIDKKRKENPFKSILQPPYVSVNKLYME